MVAKSCSCKILFRSFAHNVQLSCSFQSFFPVYPADRQWSALMRKVRDSIRVPTEPDMSWESALRERLYPSGNSIDLVPVSFMEIF